MTKRRLKITLRGGGRGADDLEFNEATFLRIQKDLQAGKIKPTGGRIFVHDNDSVGLRALVGKREISYHVQFTVRDKKTGEISERTTMMIGSYPEDSIQDVRGRARAARDLAEAGNDPRAKLRPSMFNYLDQARETSEKKIKTARLLDDLAKAGVDFDVLNERLAKELKGAKS
jgi:hypothetical protein